MADRLSGRVALVTGGSRGVGRAIALRLAAEGAAVAVNYRREADAAGEVVARITAAGGTAQAYQASIDDAEAVTAMINLTATELGPIDLLVSNAGTASSGREVFSTPDAEYLKLLGVHALGPVALIRQLLPAMRASERADIVLISSALTDAAPRNSAPYTMAKAAMEAAIRTVAREERQHNIRANIVAPGLVATDMGSKLATALGSELSELDKTYPFGRVCRPEDVAGVVAFLVSADGSYVTGQRILVDGGGAEIEIVEH
jgi:NAD(P)-dependent dehydrogenase (short-subunit alcohol dehydrogenase family)